MTQGGAEMLRLKVYLDALRLNKFCFFGKMY